MAAHAVLVTGGSGFAGGYLVDLLRGEGQEVVAPSRAELDLLDHRAVTAAFRRFRPGRVFHLAAIASTVRSWEDPKHVVLRNLEMTANVLEAANTEVPEAHVLFASSAQVYGAPEQLPVDESAPVRPLSPYAVSKAACELLAGQYVAAHGMSVVCARAFNHAGPGQSDEYLLGTLTRQVALAEGEGRPEAVLRIGDLDAARDITDVRDVVRAYTRAVDLEPGVYNVCSGRAASARDLVDVLRRLSPVEIRTALDRERLRPSEVRELRGSAERLCAATGWQPVLPLEQTVEDALNEARARLGGRLPA